jgi:hypothetical protein
MTSRRYAISLVVVAAVMFIGTIATNLIVDPQGVFGSPFFTGHLNPNMRYARYVSYKRQAADVQGLIFGSSRGYAIDPEVVRHYIPQEGRYLNVSMPHGLLTDHLPLLEYILHDKDGRGQAIKNVLLLLDLDLFGDPPWTNVNIDAFLPPEMGLESAPRFWWRYLTAVQMRSWRDTIYVSRVLTRLGIRPDLTMQLDRVAPTRASRFAVPLPRSATLSLVNDATEAAPPLPKFAGPDPGIGGNVKAEDRRAFNAVRPDFEHQVALFARFAQLCRDHGIRLTVLTSPLQRYALDGFAPADLQRVLDRLGRFAAIWDFTTQGDIADRSNLWRDSSHFHNVVGDMMLSSAFAGGSSAAATHFGRLIPQAGP